MEAEGHPIAGADGRVYFGLHGAGAFLVEVPECTCRCDDEDGDGLQEGVGPQCPEDEVVEHG